MTSTRVAGMSVLAIVFMACVFLLALTKIEDTDVWTHLSFGRWIWDHKAIPAEDPFITASKPFPYHNWLFGFVYYLAYLSFDLSGVILLKALVVTVIFFLLFTDSARPYRNVVISVIIMTGVALMVRPRFVERPDTFMMLFLSFSILSLNAYLYEHKKYLYALPFTTLLWANSHTSISLMVVPFGAFIAGGILQRHFGKLFSRGSGSDAVAFPRAPSPAQARVMAYVFLACLAASLMSPYFTDQYIHSVSALASDWWKQQIAELQPPTWQTHTWLYLFTSVVALSFLLNWKRASLIDLFLAIPFLVLPFTAQRFIWFTAITGSILARNLSAICAEKDAWSKVFSSKPLAAAVTLLMVAASTLSLLHLKPFEGHRLKEFGFGVNYVFVPEGALRYMDKRSIAGKVFNVFQTGGYITWRDFPMRKPFIDGRGFLSGDFLEKVHLAYSNPSVLDDLNRTYGFEAIVAPYPTTDEGMLYDISSADPALAHPGWALVYWDDMYLVYLKKGGRYDEVVQQDEYRFIKPAGAIERAKIMDANYRTGLFRDLARNRDETGSSKAYGLLGLLFNEVGLYREAIESLSHVRDTAYFSHLDQAYAGIAYAYGRLGNVDEAINYYRKALSIRSDALILQNLGAAYASKGDKEAAVEWYEKALKQNNRLTSVYLPLLSLYQELGRRDDAERIRRLYQASVPTKAGE